MKTLVLCMLSCCCCCAGGMVQVQLPRGEASKDQEGSQKVLHEESS